MKSPKIWIVVANGTHTKIVNYLGPNHALELIDGANFEHALKPDRDVFSSKPGRTFNSNDATRHSMEYHSEPQDVERERFAREVCEFLEKHAQANEFDRLILVASPQMMGNFRDHLGSLSKQRLQNELTKDLVQIDLDELPDHLSEFLFI